jgi:uncharacterized protein (DUF58 family)
VIRPGALVVAPAGLAFAAAAVGSLALFALALGLVVLYLGCLLALELAARRLRVVRTLDRQEVMEGRPITARFAVAGLRGLPVGVQALGPGGHWVELRDRLEYVIDRPGAHVFGPTPLRLRDDLGLFGRPILGGAPESVLVLPEPVPPPGDLRRGGAEVNGDPEPDGLRPYAPGAPMSRVHWPSAARGVALQERHFVSGRDQLPLVVVDTSGVAVVDGIARRAAGIVLALTRSGGCRVLLPGDRAATTLEDVAGWPAMHRRLAALEPGERATPVSDTHVFRVTEAEAPERGPLPPGVVPMAEWAA